MTIPAKPTWQSCYEHSKILLDRNPAQLLFSKSAIFPPILKCTLCPTAAIHRASNSLAVLLLQHLQALFVLLGVTRRAWMFFFNHIH